MSVTAPPAITALPASPDPNDRATFNARAYPWAAAQAVLATQVAAVAANVAANATDAAASASTATTQAGLATTNGAAQVALATTQAGNAATGAGTAATLASNAATSASSASTSAGTATSQAATATTQAGIATTKAGEAATSAAAAAASAASVAGGPVASVSGKTGVVVLAAADVGAEPAIAAGTAAQYFRGDKTWQAFPAGSSLVRSARTANAILGAADSTKLIDITSGTFTQTFGAAATLGSGWFCYLRNGGAGAITLDPNGVETIDGLTSFIMSPGEVRLVQCDGVALYSLLIAGVNYQEFTVSGTWIKPPGANLVYVEVVNGGCSGQANASSIPASSAAFGGAGGARYDATLKAATLGATVSVVVGAGGAAAVATTTNISGNIGGASSFNSISPLTSPSYSTVDAYAFSGSPASASCHKGGAGGGNVTSSAPSAPGVSKLDGNGGSAAWIATGPAVATAGVEPGGGGGAVATEYGSTATSGAGAKGRVRVWAW